MNTLIGTACVFFFIFITVVCLILAVLFWGLKEIKVLFKRRLPLELGIGDLVWYKGNNRIRESVTTKSILRPSGHGIVKNMKNGGVHVEMVDGRDIWISDSNVRKLFNLIQVNSNLQFRKMFT